MQLYRISRDKTAVQVVMTTIENWVNPFDGPPDLVSLSSATAAPNNGVHDPLQAEVIREKMPRSSMSQSDSVLQ